MDPLSSLQVTAPHAEAMAGSAGTDLVIVVFNEFAGAASMCAASSADHASLTIAA